MLLAAFGEERLEDGGAVGREDAGGDFYLMVEARVGEDLEAGAESATFGIIGAVNETGDAGLDDSAGAHAAGLDGDVECGVGESVVAEKAGCLAQDNYFRMGSGVAIADGAIAGTCEDLAAMDEHGAYGNFAGFGSRVGFAECFLHELDIGFHSVRELLP